MIDIYTLDPAAVIGSPFTINVDVGLANFPMITKKTKQFVVTLSCIVQTLTFATTPTASTTVEIGVST